MTTLVTLTGQSPHYLDIEGEGICKLHIYLWCMTVIILMLYQGGWRAGFSAVPTVFLVVLVVEDNGLGWDITAYPWHGVSVD